jgi:predicted nucleic acid-binding protein
MAIKVFLDTNIILDFLDQNRPNYTLSRKIVDKCIYGFIGGCISETVITNSSYILRKIFSYTELNEFFLRFSKFLTVLPFTNNALVAACLLKNRDIEDAILYQIALENDCQYFITSNLADFVSIAQPKLKVVSPEYFWEGYKKDK